MQLHQKIIHFLAQLALLKYQSLQGGVKEMYAKEEFEGAMRIQGKVSRTVFDDEEDHLAKFYEKIFRASSAIVSPTAETGRGILHKEMKLRIRPGKYCMVLATRDGGERRPCFITRFLKHHATISSTTNLRKSKHVEVIIAEVSWLEDHPSKGFFGSDTHVWRKTTEPSSPRSYILLEDVLCEAAYDIKTLKLGTALKEQVFIVSYCPKHTRDVR